MNTYTYEVKENGYIIKKNGDDYLVQLEPCIPYPNLSYQEGAEKQIQEQIENDNRNDVPTETLEEKVNTLEIALAETVERQDQDKTEIQLVIAQIIENGGNI